MIIRANSNNKIEQVKKKLGLVGDIYLINNIIESLESHKKIVPNSNATTIEEAEQESTLRHLRQLRVDVGRYRYRAYRAGVW